MAILPSLISWLIIFKSQGNCVSVVSVINSATSCATSLVSFSQNTLISLPIHFKNPIKLSNGISFTVGSKEMRKHIFCVVSILLFPEDAPQIYKYAHNSLPWIPAVLLRTGYFYKVNGTFRYSQPIVGNFLLEPHYLFLVSKTSPMNFIFDATQYPSNQLSTTFILRTSSRLDWEIREIIYACKTCTQDNCLAVSVPVVAVEKSQDQKKDVTFLDYVLEQERIIIGSGRNVWIKKAESKRRFMSQELQISFPLPDPDPFLRTINRNKAGQFPGGVDFLSIVEQLLMKSLNLFLETNQTMDHLSRLGYNTSEHWADFRFNERVEIAFFPTSYKSTSFQRQIILAHSSSFNFITCDGIVQPRRLENSLDFTVFLRPMDTTTWILYILCALTLSILSSVIIAIYGLENMCCLSWKYFQTLLYSSIDNGPGLHLPSNLNSDLYQCSFFTNAIFSAWLIFVLFLSNAYKAELTSKETVPPQPYLTYSKITELLNFTITTPTYPGLFNNTQKGTRNMRKSMFGLVISNLLQEEASNHIKYKYPQLFGFVNPKYVSGNSFSENNEHDEQNLAFHPSNRESLLGFISNCNRTAFIDVDTNINQMLAYFNSQTARDGDKIFMKGSDDFLSPQMVWELNYYNPVRAGYLAQKLYQLTQSGIYDLFRTWSSHRNVRRSSVRSAGAGSIISMQVKPVGMNVDIKTLFSIILALFIISAIVCLLECAFAWHFMKRK